MNSIYKDGTYLASNPSWHEEDSLWKAKHVAAIINRNRLSPSTVCELGCGAGEILNTLHAEFDEKVSLRGYEISPQAYEICKTKAKNNLQFLSADLLEDKNICFDVAMAIDVFEHIEDYFGFLRKFKQKGVYKIFHIPLDLSVQSVLRSSPILKCRRSVGHIHYFSKDTALATLEDTGYEVLDYFYTKGSLELPAPEWKTALLNLPRRLFFPINQDLTVRIFGGFSLLVLAK